MPNLTGNGIQSPVTPNTLVHSKLEVDADTGITAHTQLIGLKDARNGQTGKVGVYNNGLGVSLVDGLAVGKDSILTYARGSNWVRISGANQSVQVLAVAGKLTGYLVNSITSTPSFIMYDNSAAGSGTTVFGFTIPSGIVGIPQQLPHLRMNSGAWVVYTGTADITWFIDSTTT